MTKALNGGGEMGERIRAFDWSQTPLGPIEHWSQSLKTAARIMLASRQPIWLGWGKQLIKLYNDPYKAIVGGKHPTALGQPANVVWREIWDAIEPMLQTAMGGVEGTYVEARLLIMERNGYPEETYYTFSYSPIPDDDGSVGGILCVNTDDTHRVIGERQLALLRELAAQTTQARTVEQACWLSTQCLSSNPYDLPFALIYLFDPHAQRVTLAGQSVAFDPQHVLAPVAADLESISHWPFAETLASKQITLLASFEGCAGTLPRGAWDRPPQQAALIPIAAQGREQPAGILLVGLNPYRLFDDKYHRFLELVAAQIAANIATAQAYEEERQRAEALAELDRAKTTFFSNVSHEFRTPLTLILGPLEELQQQLDGNLPPQQRENLLVVQRNALRLLKLVNTLLDFSRIEAGRIQASFAPTDLPTFTTELASVFRSAIERAGLRLLVNCPPLPEPVYIDREMWEKVVFNLLSNAFKFTFAGEINVSLQQRGSVVELAVRDTGTGIPATDLPHIFERFHRVETARGRTFEGSGIGLALVQELVKLHGGSVAVESELDRGTTFRVTLPLGSAHLPAERINALRPAVSTGIRGEAYVEEALRWLPHGAEPAYARVRANGASEPASQPEAHEQPRPRLLLADDNADMREYVYRLLSQEYDLVMVNDGEAALQTALQQPFELVLSDVMMPGLDGYELLRALRADKRTRELPIILLSARAGEQAQIEGLQAGADDYLTKPFSANELKARVRANLALARTRREASQREYQLRTAAEQLSERLQRILEGIKDDFVMYDNDWRYVYVNEQAARRLGYQREQLIGQRIWDLFPGAVGNLFYRMLLQAKAEQRDIAFEHYYQPWDVWIENRAYFIPDGMLLFSTDITARKQAEAALRESEERFRNMADNIPQLAWMADAQGHRFWFNKRWYDYTGTSFEQVQGWNWTRLHHPEHVQRVVSGFKQACESGEPWEDLFPLTGVDGAVRWFLARAMPIRNAAGQVVRWFGTNTDVTEQRAAEQIIRESEERFRNMADHSPVMIWMTDPDANCTYLSKSWYAFTGQRPEHALGRGWLDAVHPDDQASSRQIFAEANQQQQPFRIDYRLRRWDGVYRWAIDSAAPRLGPGGEFLGYIGSVIDITERKQQELNTQFLLNLDTQINHLSEPSSIEQEVVRQVASYLDATHCYFAQIDGEAMVIRNEWTSTGHTLIGRHPLASAFSTQALEQLRRNSAIVINDVASDSRTTALAAAYQECAIEALIVMPVIQQAEWVGTLTIASSHTKNWRADKVQLLHDVAARVWPLLEQARTRAALRASQARLQVLYAQEQAARSQAEEASRLKDEFLATVSHELRTPLTAFLGYAQMLQRRTHDEAYVSRTVARMVRSARDQAQLIEDLLDVSRIVSGKMRIEMQPIDLIAVIRSALDTVRPAIEAKGLKLRLDLNPDDRMVQGDANRLQQVIWNLLSNAVKFTPAGGQIQVQLQWHAHVAELTVSDTGQGISPAFLPYVFDRFRQADSSSQRVQSGLGLGLAIVRHLIELHGGSVKALSAGEGQGASFVVRLPLLKDLTDTAFTSNSRSAEAPGLERQCPPELLGLRILVVDDQAEILQLLREILEACGAIVQTCPSARDGLEQLQHWKPDLLISDIAMPNEDGYWLIRKLRELPTGTAGNIPAIALTAYVRLEERMQVLASGFQHYVPKPVDLDELRSVVAQLARTTGTD